MKSVILSLFLVASTGLLAQKEVNANQIAISKETNQEAAPQKKVVNFSDIKKGNLERPKTAIREKKISNELNKSAATKPE